MQSTEEIISKIEDSSGRRCSFRLTSRFGKLGSPNQDSKDIVTSDPIKRRAAPYSLSAQISSFEYKQKRPKRDEPRYIGRYWRCNRKFRCAFRNFRPLVPRNIQAKRWNRFTALIEQLNKKIDIPRKTKTRSYLSQLVEKYTSSSKHQPSRAKSSKWDFKRPTSNLAAISHTVCWNIPRDIAGRVPTTLSKVQPFQRRRPDLKSRVRYWLLVGLPSDKQEPQSYDLSMRRHILL